MLLSFLPYLTLRTPNRSDYLHRSHDPLRCCAHSTLDFLDPRSAHTLWLLVLPCMLPGISSELGRDQMTFYQYLILSHHCFGPHRLLSHNSHVHVDTLSPQVSFLCIQGLCMKGPSGTSHNAPRLVPRAS